MPVKSRISALALKPKAKVSYLGYCLYGPSGHPDPLTFKHHGWSIPITEEQRERGYSIQPIKLTVELKRVKK